MSRLLEWLDVTPMVQKISLLGLVLVLCGVGFYWVIAEPLMAQIDGVKRDIQDLDAKVQHYAQSDGQLAQAQKEFFRWKSNVSQQRERLGLDVSMSQVLSDMAKIAEEAEIILTLWKTDQPERVEGPQGVARRLQLEIEGGYHNVARFLERTQYLSKMMGVTTLTMDRVETGAGNAPVRATVDFVGYERKPQALANHHDVPIGPLSIEGKG